MSDFPKYPIETLNDLVHIVTADNVESLANDLGDFLRHMVLAKELTQIRNPRSGTSTVSFTWIDYGQRNCETVVQPFGNAVDEQFIIHSQPNPSHGSLLPSQ